MAALPYIPLYVADYLADTAHLSTLEHGAYLMLIFNYWQRGGSFKAKDERSLNERLARVARMTNDEWESVREALQEFFNVTGTEWSHDRIDSDLESVRVKSEKASAAGKASARSRVSSGSSRGKDETKTEKADDQRTFNGRSADDKRTLNHSDSDSDSKKVTTAVDPAKPDEFPFEFEQAWKAYPSRKGDNPKRRAAKAWNARRKEGHSAEEILAGVKRYAEAVRAEGKEGSEFVKQAATFFGPDKAFLADWDSGGDCGEESYADFLESISI